MTTSTAIEAAPRPRLTRRQRRRLSVGVQYAVFVAVLVVHALMADWESLQQNFAQGDLARQMFPVVLTVALRNTVVYTLTGFGSGLLLGVIVHAANIQDADGAGDLLRRLKRLYPWLKVVFADSAYDRLAALLAGFLLGLTLVVIRRLAGTKGFVLLPRRWVAERQLAGDGEPDTFSERSRVSDWRCIEGCGVVAGLLCAAAAGTCTTEAWLEVEFSRVGAAVEGVGVVDVDDVAGSATSSAPETLRYS